MVQVAALRCGVRVVALLLCRGFATGCLYRFVLHWFLVG